MLQAKQPRRGRSVGLPGVFGRHLPVPPASRTRAFGHGQLGCGASEPERRGAAPVHRYGQPYQEDAVWRQCEQRRVGLE